MITPRTTAALLLLLTSTALPGAARCESSAPPNFIVIFCDNLGYGDIEPFGSTVHRTPHLNRMAEQGRKFTHFCVTAGVCTPSRASLLTGCYPQRVQMHTNPRDGQVLRPLSPYGLNPDEITIAEVLQERGYATGIFGKWHLGDQPEFLPTRQGFDYFFGIPYSDDMTRDVGLLLGERLQGNAWPEIPLMKNETVIEAPADRNLLTKRCTEEVLDFITQHKAEPFFVYFPQPMPGSTRAPFASPDFKGKSKNGPWGDAIEEIDWSTGKILRLLEELKIEDHTLVIWLSDNGAPMAPDMNSPERGTNRPLHGRGYTTSEGAFRSPTIMWWPGNVEPATTCAELATTMDLLPTFAHMSQPTTSTHAVDGHDITSLITGTACASSPYESFYYYYRDQLQAVRSGPWKLFLPLESFDQHPHFRKGQPARTLLFNVVEDISSKNNVAAEHPDVVRQLAAYAEAARAELGDRNRPGDGQRSIGKVAGEPVAQVPPSENALQLIEGVRGGRHWVNARTAPPKSARESMKTLKIEPGLEIELVAAEPLVFDPVAITFDERGRMFVVEYGDYPIGPEEGGDPLSRVVYLEDINNDGKVDRRHVFADKLNFAHSLMPLDGGLLVGAQTEILFLKDTNGDHVADVRKTLFNGFTPAHPQMQIGNPRWGLDNWIYLNYGPGKITSSRDPDSTVTMPRKDFRFHPGTLKFEADSGMGQFGNTVDRWGHRFYCTNRNPIMATLLPPTLMTRNPYSVLSRGHYDVGKSGGETRVYPRVDMKSNYLSHAGTHTSACGVTAYLGDLLGPDYLNSVFVCEPIGHLVTRSIVEPNGVTLAARRARPNADFIASTDTWFRPASLANGPDGALYLADMYRLWVEHPKFLPPEIAAKLDWRAGDDRGRIYRIVPKESKPRSFTPPQNIKQTIALLQDDNAWRQFLGQRLLVRQQLEQSIPEIRLILQGGKSATSRLHALWTLDGMGALKGIDVHTALDDPDPHVRRDAVKLASHWLSEDVVFEKVTQRASDGDPRVRFQVALTLGESDRAAVTRLLVTLALQDGRDSWFASGLLTSVGKRAGDVLTALVEDRSFADKGDGPAAQLVKQLAASVGARGDQNELAAVMNTLASRGAGSEWWRAAIISGLGQGLSRHRGTLGRTSLPVLLAKPPELLTASVTAVRDFVKQAGSTAANRSNSPADRAAAVELMAYQPFSDSAQVFRELLAAGQPVEVQLATINALSANGSATAGQIVLDRWPQLGPVVRGPALRLLLRRTSTTRQALEAMAAGKLRSAALSIDQRVRLLKHSDKTLRAMAVELFGGAVSANRQQVGREYQKALALQGSAAAGGKVFKRICSQCHRIDGQGHQAGPDISDVRNRSRAALLYDILDPNAKVEPRFTAYTVVTDDGKVYSGLIASETSEAVVLRMAEGKEQTIARGQIEEIRDSNVSLMPEGIEKDVKLQDMADLLEFLKSRK